MSNINRKKQPKNATESRLSVSVAKAVSTKGRNTTRGSGPRGGNRRPYAPTGAETVAVRMDGVSSMELFKQPDGRYLKALFNVDLNVPVGVCHGVAGNNCFELELLAEIIGNVKPHEDGRCSLLEIGMMRQKRRILPHVYYLNDQRVLFEHMHVLGYLMFASEHKAGEPEERQADWLRLLLRTGLYPFALTYIRALEPAEYALVSALLAYSSAAKLVVMDLSHIPVPARLYEPFAALVKELLLAGKTVVMTSSNCDLIQHTCTSASFLIDGTIPVSDTVGALCRAYDHQLFRISSPDPQETLFVLSEAYPDLRASKKDDEVALYGAAEVAADYSVSGVASVLEHAHVPIGGIRIPPPSLQEAFLEARRLQL